MDGEFMLDTVADAVGDWLAPHPAPAVRRDGTVTVQVWHPRRQAS
jgi:hypothetical protein